MDPMDTVDLTPLCDLSARAVFFPVRHHSPAAARLVRELALRLRPSAVLIECPADFNDRLEELHLPHQPPLAIYSYVRLGDGTRRGAFYPLCEHSPEWQALRAGREVSAEVRFIDLPWADIAAADAQETSNRFSDAAFLRSRYIAALCRKLGVDDFHTLWDTLFEIDAGLSAEAYLRRCHELCGHMRLLEGPGALSDRRREAFMAGEVRDAIKRHKGSILVVVGGGHCLPLYWRVRGRDIGEFSDPPTYQPSDALPGEERGIALTPYSFERLDSLVGYEAGMPNPGFYQQVWQDRRGGRDDTHRTLLARVVEALREKKQPINSADLIAAESTARALASLRAHGCVWRTDLVDGLTTSLVKEPLTRDGHHPLLEAIHEVLRGGQHGALAAGTARPPLVLDILAQLKRHDLEARMVPREVELALENEPDRPRSEVLHRLRLLDIAGYQRIAGSDLIDREEAAPLWERWRIAWSPDFEARAIEAARYGPALADAAAASLAEQAGAIERDAGAAAELLLDAALAGLTDLAAELRQRVAGLIRAEGDFFRLTQALGHLLYLYRYETALRTAGSAALADLLREAYQRSLWLLESLGQTAGRDAEILAGVAALRETFERCESTLGLDRQELVAVLARVGADRGQGPAVRGAALGAQWSLGATDADGVRGQLRLFTEPDWLGDFLNGLFTLAREQVQRQRDLLLAIHEVVAGWSQDEFLHALPAVRLAFTSFTPREKHHLALTLRQTMGLADEPEAPALEVDVETAARALALEGRLFAAAARYGVRGEMEEGR
jgi:hypothetical protein